MFSKIIIGICSSIILFGLIGAGVWFGGPMVFHHFIEAEASLQTVKLQRGAINSDRLTVNRMQASCAAQSTRSFAAGKAIHDLSQPVVPKDPNVEDLITVEELQQKGVVR